jgi:hypothetical protein
MVREEKQRECGGFEDTRKARYVKRFMSCMSWKGRRRHAVMELVSQMLLALHNNERFVCGKR